MALTSRRAAEVHEYEMKPGSVMSRFVLEACVTLKGGLGMGRDPSVVFCRMGGSS